MGTRDMRGGNYAAELQSPAVYRDRRRRLAEAVGGGTVVIWGAGQTGRRLSKHLLRGGAPLEVFVDIDPHKIGSTLRGKPIVGVDDLPRHLGAGTVVLAAVASRGARQLIRGQLDAIGLVEGREYWCVA